MERPIKVLFASFEAAPFSKTGGLGDVAGSLPRYFDPEECEVRLILPKLSSIPREYQERMVYIDNFNVPLGWRNCYCGLFEYQYENVKIYFLDNEYYFKRGNIYGEFDDGERVAFFSKAVLETLLHLPDFMPDVIHCNDWHTSLIPVYLNETYRHINGFEYVKTMLTIHNLKFQGQFSEYVIGDVCGLHGTDADRQMRVEDGSANYMLGGLRYADIISTVSPTYADEICTPAFGEGLDWLFRERRDRLHGILNGVDYNVYDPHTDPHIPFHYSESAMGGKTKDKKALQEELGLEVNADRMLLAIVTRLTEQKGIDLITYNLPWIAESGAQLVVLGTGEERYVRALTHFAGIKPDTFAARIEFSEPLSRRIYAGADAFLMPSQFEPCGLSQIISMRYGTLPIVRETGGLKDTVTAYNKFTGEGTGFSFANFNAHELRGAICEALELYGDHKKWSALRRQAMAADFSWNASAARYLEIYRQLAGR